MRKPAEKMQLDPSLGYLALPARTWRRTPKDIDGAQWNVPCEIMGRCQSAHPTRLHPHPRKSKWFWVCFDDGTKSKRHESNLGLNDFPGVKISQCEGPDPSGRWWQSSRGTLERVATIYEIATLITGAPQPGWTLTDGYHAVGEQRNSLKRNPSTSETDERLQTELFAKRLERTENQVKSAAVGVKRFERRRKLAETLLAKWTKKLAISEQRLAKLKKEEASS